MRVKVVRPETALDLESILCTKLDLKPKKVEQFFDFEEREGKLIIAVHRDTKGKHVWIDRTAWSIVNNYVRGLEGAWDPQTRTWEIPKPKKEEPKPIVVKPELRATAPSKIGETSRYGTHLVIPMDSIISSPYQVRVDYGDIDALAKNIKGNGLLQPILVRPIDNKYEIVHGHRRHRAVKSLGWKFIDAFVKELSDSNAIVIQGSENIYHQHYTAIEEARLYKNYQDFLKKEIGKSVSYSAIAKQFETSPSNVENKVALLWLPDDIQEKLHKREIPFSKARQLTILTREASADRHVPNREGTVMAPKTNHFYSEIRKLAEEIEKGALGGLRTESAVAQAAQAIRDGIEFDEAVQKAKEHEAVQIARKQLKKGASPKEILRELEKTQLDASELQDSILEANLGLVKAWLREGLLRCPYCGQNHLVWKCSGKEVLNDD